MGCPFLSERMTYMNKQKMLEMFQNAPLDTYAVFQLKNERRTRDYRFEPMKRLEKLGLKVKPELYEPVYAGILAKEDAGSKEDMLEALYLKFNIARPHDFTGHSMSVSDVIALRMDGKVTVHYVDSVGFHELPDFFRKEHLKNAEIAVEDDYGMIDGIINNGRKQDEKKPSILGQLQGMKPIASDAQKKRERITHDR